MRRTNFPGILRYKRIINLDQMTRPSHSQHKKKRTSRIVNFADPAGHRAKLKESEKRDKYLDLARELKKTMEDESDADTTYNWRTRYRHQRIDAWTGGLGKKKTSEDHPNKSIFLISQNTKSFGDLR